MMTGRDDLGENYRGTFDGHLPFGTRPALLIVDFVMAYLDPASPLFAGADNALASTARLLAASRAVGIPIVFTNVIFEPGGSDGGLFYKKIPALSCLDRGSPLGEFPRELSPRPGEHVITKQYPSAFFGTGLIALLEANDVDTLLIAGVSTSGCVRASALDALQHGFAPFVVGDACADRHVDPHQASLFDLQAKYAEVIDEQQAIGKIKGLYQS